MRVTLQPAYVLHRRPYSESSLLLEIFSQMYGRVSLIAKGVRKGRSSQRALLQPFTSLLLSWQGKTELMTLTAVEPDGNFVHLQKECLLAAFYLNELIMYLLPKQDPHPLLYQFYRKAMIELQTVPLNQAILRLFEKKLLEELGYGLRLTGDFETQAPFFEGDHYRYCPELGFKRQLGGESDGLSFLVFSGKSLISLANEVLVEDSAIKDAKRLMRLALKPLLAGKELKSRELFSVRLEDHD